VLWISCLVALVIGVDFSRLRTSRNLDLAIFIALTLVLFDSMRFFRTTLTPVVWRLLDSVYAIIFALNALLLLRALWQAAVPGSTTGWRPNLRGRPLAACARLLLACYLLMALQHDADDAGYFTNLGAAGHARPPHRSARIRAEPVWILGTARGCSPPVDRPSVGESSVTSPVYLLLFLLVGASAFIARRTSAAGLALLSAAVAIAFSLLKIQPTGTYVAWAYPLLLLGSFAARPVGIVTGLGARDSERADRAEDSPSSEPVLNVRNPEPRAPSPDRFSWSASVSSCRS
jgi:hypothetical protein